MCAWRDDLISMRQTYSQITETCEKYKEVGDLIEDKFPKLEEMIRSNSEFFFDLPDVKDSLQKLTGHYCVLAQTQANANDRLTHIENIQRRIQGDILGILAHLNYKESKQIKPWWKRIWKRKEKISRV